MSSRRNGDVAEVLATAYLLELGYEVFVNASAVGPIDILAISEDGRIRKFDVKRAHKQANGVVYANKVLRNPEQFSEMGGELLFVYIDEEFNSVISDKEDEFYEMLSSRGYKCRDLSQKTVMINYYLVLLPDRWETEVYGAVELQALGNFNSYEMKKLIAGNDVRGFRIKRKELVPRVKQI